MRIGKHVEIDSFEMVIIGFILLAAIAMICKVPLPQ